jgi:hypothetical protein
VNVKLIGLVILGIIISGIVYWLLFMWLGPIISNMGEGGGMIVGFFVVPPLAFLIGSIPTGYFSYHDIEDKWSLLKIAPALYVSLLFMSVALIGSLLHGFMNNNWSFKSFLYDYWGLPLISLLWYLASAGGVFLGYYLRERFAKWWYGD